MRRLVPLVTVLAAVVAATPGPASAAERTAAGCAKERRPLDGSALVRVWERQEAVYACSLENGRRVFLGHHTPGSSSGVMYVRPLAVAGRLVAFQRMDCGRERCAPAYFAIVNVHSGKVRMKRRLAYPRRVDELVLRPDGSAAWIEDAAGRRTLRRRDTRGEAVLASGDVRDLALGYSLYWTEGGVARSAPLKSAPPRRQPEPRRRPCGYGEETVYANPWTRVFSDEFGSSYGACSTETGRTVDLGESSASSAGEEYVVVFDPVRRLVPRFYRQCSYGGQTPVSPPSSCELNQVDVTDVRTGATRVLAQVPDDRLVESLVMKPNASVAFLQSGQVRIVDRAGDRIVGAGTRLALSATSVVYWTERDGPPRSAPLGG